MKCPVCESQGLKSKVYGGDSCISTCMGFQSFYDEEGRYHRHDPNSHFSPMHCSNGHKFGVSASSRCGVEGCDFGHDEKITVYETVEHEVKKS